MTLLDLLFLLSIAALLAYAFWHFKWTVFAWIVSRVRVRDYLIERAMRTPYTNIPGYMNRYWLFNAYDKVNGNEVTPIKWLPSVRIHHILRRDNDRHLHDHPWDARTVILKGWYTEVRLEHGLETMYENMRRSFLRIRGYTGPINHGEYHTITSVSDGGVWTLFITFGYLSTWGFLVDGEKVPWREYMDMYPEKPWAQDDKDSQQ